MALVALIFMRIGEIAVVCPGFKNRHEFIKSVCDEIVVKTDKLVFGRLQVNEQLVIHLYGLDLTEKNITPAWDLVSKKLLGYIVLFSWNNADSYAKIKDTIESLSKYELPLVIAATLQNGSFAFPKKLVNMELDLSDQAQLTFCKISDPQSVKNVLVTLINSVIERTH